MRNRQKIPVSFWVFLAMVAIFVWQGPGLLMDALSYTPPGVRPPKGLEKKAHRIPEPCKAYGPGLVVVTMGTTSSGFSIDPCAPLTYLKE